MSSWGVRRHACLSTPITRTPSKRDASAMSTRRPSLKSGVGGIPWHSLCIGDARHRQMVDDQARQRPAHRRMRELGMWIGWSTRVLTPHMRACPASVAAHAHMQDGGAPPVGLVGQTPDHRVACDALTPAPSAPRILIHDPVRQHGPILPHTLAPHFQPEAVKASERAQVRAIKDSIRLLRSFR